MGRETEKRLLETVWARLRPGEKVLAAVSGGADSVALLHLLHALAAEGTIRLAAAHFEHGIRGEDSLADMRFVEEECARLGVECLCGQGDVPAEAKRRRMGLEETAREMRRAFLEEARRQSGADAIALAHHRDDQAETVLMHILRGGGVAGAAGMRPRAGVWVRPLLDVPRADLRAYLREKGLSWREDATNALDDTPRNRLRNAVLPMIGETWPGAAAALARHAQIAARESDFLDAAAREWQRGVEEAFPYGRLLRLDDSPHEAVLARALKAILGREAQFSDIERLLALCRAGSGRFLPRGGAVREAWRTREGLWLLNGLEPPDEAPFQPRGGTRLGALGCFFAEQWDQGPIRDEPNAQALNAEALEGAVARPWRAGDRIRPLGMAGKSRLLSDVYAEAGVPAPARRYMPVLARGEDILWAVGCRIAEEARLTPGCRAARVQWTWDDHREYECNTGEEQRQ